MENVRKFLELTKAASMIRESDLSWETKYDLIFSERVSIEIGKLGIRFDYYDPTSYEEDVNAYVDAIEEKARELGRIPELHYDESSLEIKVKRYARDLRKRGRACFTGDDRADNAYQSVCEDVANDLLKIVDE